MKVHIGKEIESKFQESGLRLGAFAEQIDTGERNVYSIFTRKDISAEMLTKISNVLKFNFFSLYEGNLKEDVLLDPQVQYRAKNKTISVNLELAGDMNAMKDFQVLLQEITTTAAKHGFKLM